MVLIVSASNGNISQRDVKAGPPRAVGGPRAKLRIEAPASEESGNTLDWHKYAFQSISWSQNVKNLEL